VDIAEPAGCSVHTVHMALREELSAGRCRQQRYFLVSSCLPTSVFGCYDNQQGTQFHIRHIRNIDENKRRVMCPVLGRQWQKTEVLVCLKG
jgi:hypothetical protein